MLKQSGTLVGPVILVVEQVREMEAMIRSGILSCPNELDFCHGTHEHIFSHLKVEKPDLLIAPLQMDDMNAVDLVTELRAKVGLIPSIFLSDPNHVSIQSRLSDLGAFDFLPKPYDMNDLFQKMKHVIDAFHHAPAESSGHETPLEHLVIQNRIPILGKNERKKSTAA